METSLWPFKRGPHARLWLIVPSIATIVALIYSVRSAVGYVIQGRPIDWVWGVGFEFTYWYVWAAYAPLVFWLSNHFAPRKLSRVRSILILCAFGLVIALAQSATEWGVALAIEYLRGIPSDELARRIQQAQRSIPLGIFSNVIIYSLIVGAYYGYQYYRGFHERQLRSAELESLLARADLQNLKAQLQPHFLFNTLNTISILIRRDPQLAHKTLILLSDLLRVSLNDQGAQEVSLRDELDFLDGYLEIEQTRFQDRLQIKRSIQPEALSAAVPNLILQPLVENAIKHGIAKKRGPGTISIIARRENSHLRLEVKDNGPGISDAGDANGVGIPITIRRLQQLYGPQHDFQLRESDEGGVHVTVIIPFRIYEHN